MHFFFRSKFQIFDCQPPLGGLNDLKYDCIKYFDMTFFIILDLQKRWWTIRNSHSFPNSSNGIDYSL